MSRLHGLNAPKVNSDLSRDSMEHEETKSKSSKTDGNSFNKIGFKKSGNCTISRNIQ